MCTCHRRATLTILAGAVVASLSSAKAQSLAHVPMPSAERHRFFAAEAERMRIKAVAAGDQSFGAVVVKGDEIIGWGPSRVVVDRNPRAYAERVAIMDAQLRLAAVDLGGAVLYSTTRACPMCEEAAAMGGIGGMYWGPEATDAGAPRWK